MELWSTNLEVSSWIKGLVLECSRKKCIFTYFHYRKLFIRLWTKAKKTFITHKGCNILQVHVNVNCSVTKNTSEFAKTSIQPALINPYCALLVVVLLTDDALQQQKFCCCCLTWYLSFLQKMLLENSLKIEKTTFHSK